MVLVLYVIVVDFVDNDGFEILVLMLIGMFDGFMLIDGIYSFVLLVVQCVVNFVGWQFDVFVLILLCDFNGSVVL